jgi:hypothetical protein
MAANRGIMCRYVAGGWGVAASLSVQGIQLGVLSLMLFWLCAWRVDMLSLVLMLTQKGRVHGLGLGGGCVRV